MDFIFGKSSPVEVSTRTQFYFSMFSGCYSSRRFVELCHGLLVMFDGSTPDQGKVDQLSARVLAPGSNLTLSDYVFGQVSFGPVRTQALANKINDEIDRRFPSTSVKRYTNRDTSDQLAIMRFVVISMFMKYKGNVMDPLKSSSSLKTKTAVRRALTDPLVVLPEKVVVNPPPSSKASVTSPPPRKKPRITVDHPTLLDELLATAPTILVDEHASLQSTNNNQQTITPTPPTYGSFYLEIEKRFNPDACRIATSNEVAPFAPRVYVEGDLFETNLYCAPLEFYLLRDLKHRNHGFKCDDLGLQPSLGKTSASLDVPMSVSFISDDVAMTRPGHAIFASAFSRNKLHIDLPLCLKFVLEHGSSNRARDGVGPCGEVEYGSRIDFGCAGSGSTELSPGVWRPDLLCGIDVFDKVSLDIRNQIKTCLGSVYDCIQDASDQIQKHLGKEPVFNFEPRHKVYGSTLCRFLGATMMKNEWCTLQAKCLTRRDQTDRHKDTKNCSWVSYDKTGALCFVLLDAFGIFWSLKFLSNSRHVIGSYYDKLLGVETLCARIEKHFANLDDAYSSFLDEYDGSFKPVDLKWRNPWGFFLDHRCKWSQVDDTSGKNEIVYQCLVLPTTIVRDFWLSPGVSIIVEMRSLGLSDEKLLELILLGGYQTSWFRFYHIGMKMVEGKLTADPFKTYIQLAEESFGSITGGPRPRADPPGINVKDVYYPNDCQVKHEVIKCIMSLLMLVNNCSHENFGPVFLRDAVLQTSAAISEVKGKAELGEFRLMLILQMCALSSVVLRPSTKLLNLLYPIPGKGSANHLLEVNVQEQEHDEALKRVSHYFGLEEFGDNGGESLLCETLPGRNVWDVFFPLESLFLLNASGQPMQKKYGTTIWIPLDDKRGMATS